MKVGNLVRCIATKRMGVVLELRRARVKTMVLIQWPDSTRWVDAAELLLIGN